MASQLELGIPVTIDDTIYYIAEHPTAPGTVYSQEGQHSVVYQVVSKAGEKKALKAFKREYQLPAQLLVMPSLLARYTDLPGLAVCQRTVLTKRRHGALLSRYPDLAYGMLMPWIEGPTWMQVLRRRNDPASEPLTPEQSLALARSLAGVLARMHQKSLAHCNLSGSNMLLPGLTQSNPSDRQSSIELVDLEQLYSPAVPSTELSLDGSPAYALHTTPDGLWGRRGDRFAGAVLMVEMLGWCDERVREAAWGESYFNPKEMQQETDRYQTLVNVLQERWGATVAGLFERAWHSEALVDCPSCAEWMFPLLETVPEPEVGAEALVVLDPLQESITEESIVEEKKVKEVRPVDTVRELISLAQQFEDWGQPVSALQTYRQALGLSARSGPKLRPLVQELELIAYGLEARQREVTEAAMAKPIPQASETSVEEAEEELAVLFNESLAAYEQGEWQQAKELLKARELLGEIVERRTGAKIDQQKATQLPEAMEGRPSRSGRGGRRRSDRDVVPLAAALVVVLAFLGVGAYLFLHRSGGPDVGGEAYAALARARAREAATSQAVATATAQAYGTATARTHRTATVRAGKTAMAQAYDLATIETREMALATATAQALTTGTAQALATATAQAREMATVQSQETALAQAHQTATAQALAMGTAQALATATAQARETATVQSQETALAQAYQTATAQALATGTARALATATAQSLKTALAQAYQTATVQALPTGTAQALPTATAQAWETATFQSQQTATAQAHQTVAVQTRETATASPEINEPEEPVIELEPASGRVGTPVTVVGHNWPDGSEVFFTLAKGGGPVALNPSNNLETSVVPENGLFETTIELPEGEDWENQPQVVIVAFTSDFKHTAVAVLSVLTPTLTEPSATPEPPSLEVSPLQVAAGAVLTVNGAHWPADSTVGLTFARAPKSAVSIRINPETTVRMVSVGTSGTFETEVAVPEPEGEDWEDEGNLILVGFTSDYQETAVAPFEIIPRAESSVNHSP